MITHGLSKFVYQAFCYSGKFGAVHSQIWLIYCVPSDGFNSLFAFWSRLTDFRIRFVVNFITCLFMSNFENRRGRSRSASPRCKKKIVRNIIRAAVGAYPPPPVFLADQHVQSSRPNRSRGSASASSASRSRTGAFLSLVSLRKFGNFLSLKRYTVVQIL